MVDMDVKGCEGFPDTLQPGQQASVSKLNTPN